MKIKTKSNLLIVIFTLATILGFFGFIIGTVSANSEPTIFEVVPTGDVNLDGDNIQAAIDAANAGDEIVLKAGTFMLGKYIEDDSWVSTSRGSFRYASDLWPFGVRDSLINPRFYIYGGYEGDSPPFPQFIVVDKPLIIRGENSPDSDPAERTVISVANTWLEEGETLYADFNGFILTSSDVTIKNLRFHNMIQGINIISAGTTIEDCVFEDAGHYSVQYFMDDYSVYPNYPSYKNPVKSYLRRNQWINAIQAMHLWGSEIIVTDNQIEIRATDPGMSNSIWAIIFGGIPPNIWPEWSNVPDVYTNSLCRNNLVENNVIEGDENSWYGAFYFGGYGAPIIENKITHNIVRNMWAMVESWGGAPVERNTITNNVVEDVGVAGWGGHGVVLDSVRRGYIPTRNIISGNKFIDTISPIYIYAGEENSLIHNDYRQSNSLGWETGDGCIHLGAETSNNYVLETLFPKKTTMHDQIRNEGFNNRIIGMPPPRPYS
jgi:hypothetical protein